eukprot:TRINITY_DN15689_c0_g1_i1.p1 TRINITY_DN15689_c0_g1~~TRINITY_DN15689_c0_g1_i1.p1  ORF type:complete len:486 (+),score=86.71 TRINITY_DN15689_c0_g1_i1:32-1459(+)
MNPSELRQRGKEMIDLVADYWETIQDRDVMPNVHAGYLRPLIPSEAPQTPDNWEDIFKDIERVIMPGVTHWQSPNFHAWYPTAASSASIVADILCGGLGVVGFSWASSPACTELEIVVLDWLAKALGLPEFYLASRTGGGVIQGTASEATHVAMLAARAKAIDREKERDPNQSDADIIQKLVVYTSKESHSSVERAALLSNVQFRLIEADETNSLRGESLVQAIEDDKRKGLVPFMAVATFGTTPSCSFDRVDEIGPICNKEEIWLHIDAAYAGCSFVCPELRKDGIQFSDSFSINPHKWLLVGFDCTALWLKDSQRLVNAFTVDRIYLKHDKEGLVHDFRHWHVPFGRRFRSLKLWFVLRIMGIEGLQNYIRKHCDLAKKFEELVLADNRFELAATTSLGLVCFRLKGKDELTQKLIQEVHKTHKIMLTASSLKGVFNIRFVVCSEKTEETDVVYAWKLISELAGQVLGTPCNL